MRVVTLFLLALVLLTPLTHAGVLCDGVAGIVTVANESNFTFANATFSVVLRAKWTTASGRGLVTKSNGTTGWSIQISAGSILAIIYEADGGNAVTDASITTSYNDGAWGSYGFVLTTNTTTSGGNDIPAMYARGVQNPNPATVSRDGQAHGTGTSALRFCLRQGFFTAMSLEDVWIFSGTVTADFIKRAEMSNQKYLPHNGLTLLNYWPMDDCQPAATANGAVFVDRASATPNDATGSGGTGAITCIAQNNGGHQLMYNGIW